MELDYIEHISPILKDGVKNYLIDIDGTITDDVPNEEPERMVTCLPYPDALETVNKWYDEGHQICFFTSRTENLKQITIDWLDKHGFKYHSVLCGNQEVEITTGLIITWCVRQDTKVNLQIWLKNK